MDPEKAYRRGSKGGWGAARTDARRRPDGETGPSAQTAPAVRAGKKYAVRGKTPLTPRERERERDTHIYIYIYG